MRGKIVEIFESIQGEGLYFGERQVFVRFFGCNLACRFCDTKLTVFNEYASEELFEKIKVPSGRRHSVAFTGGEPLLQKDFLLEVLKLTHKNNIKNYLETNGTMPDELSDVIEYVDIVSMDFKLPSSSGQRDFWQAHRDFLKVASRREAFVKAVICENTTEEDILESVNLIKHVNPSVILILQPDSFTGQPALKEKLEKFKVICASNGVTACVIPQVHRIAGVR